MHAPGHALPLTRRLLGQYLMFGLACLFFCLACSLSLAWRGELTERVSIAAIVALLILGLGGVVLHRTVALTSQIEDQLRRIADASSSVETLLQPLSGSGPAAAGWNAILDRVANQMSLADIEKRLSHSLSGVSQHRMAEVLSSLPEGVAVTDAAGRIVLANKALASFSNGPVETSLIGKRIDDVLSWAASKDAQAIQQKLAQSSRPVVFELQQGDELSDGVLRVGRYLLVDTERSATEYVWSIRDITQQRLAEETRNQFVFTATHELRTPLANIKAYAETLAFHDDIDVEEQKRFYNTIGAEATRLSRFVDELLNVSRMQSGALALSRNETDIRRLVEEVVEHVRPEMEGKLIRFEMLLSPKLPKLMVDKDKVAASLVNLLGNATKYTPEQGRVRLEVEADAGEVRFRVEDSGIGISEKELPKVFDKFFRSADERVQEITGTGLGLAFTQEVARLHGGKVLVHSELNKGSQFTLALPA
ncbi:MAG: hypothetical protein B7Z55_00725 [Planctomycetales bacterium 12-60-4]|nr:MAG: hypothetical protein B7Z55_00725 [Planctomycetales bacterium 12-60-4]